MLPEAFAAGLRYSTTVIALAGRQQVVRERQLGPEGVQLRRARRSLPPPAGAPSRARTSPCRQAEVTEDAMSVVDGVAVVPVARKVVRELQAARGRSARRLGRLARAACGASAMPPSASVPVAVVRPSWPAAASWCSSAVLAAPLSRRRVRASSVVQVRELPPPLRVVGLELDGPLEQLPARSRSSSRKKSDAWARTVGFALASRRARATGPSPARSPRVRVPGGARTGAREPDPGRSR